MILELVDRLSGPAREAARRMGGLTRSANKMADSFARITDGGRKARRALRQLGADAKKLPGTRGAGGLDGDGVGRRRDPHRIWGRGTMATAGRDMSRFGRMSLGAMTSVLNVFADFDQKMGDVAAVTRGLAEDPAMFQAIRDKAKEIGEATKFTAVEAASGFEMLGMAGVDAADQLKMIDHVMNLSAAGALGLGQATDIATDVMMGFNLEADQMGRIADVLAVGATSATTTVAGLGKGLSKVAPAAAQLGVSLEETTAFLAAFANMGIKGGIGGRSLRRILISLVAPSKRARKEMRRLGVDVTDAEGKMRRPVEIFQDLTTALRKLPEAKRIQKLHKIFQAFGMVGAAGAVNQFNKALEKAPENTEEVNDIIAILGRMMDGTGESAEMAGRRMDTMRGDSLKLTSALQGAAITIGEEFNDELRAAIREVTEAVRSFGEWAKEHPRLIKFIGKLWAGVATLAVVFGPLIVALDTFVKLGLIAKSLGLAGSIDATGAAAGKATGRLAGFVSKFGALAAVGTIAYTFGVWADETFRISDALAGLCREGDKFGNVKQKLRGGAAQLGSLSPEEREELGAAKADLEAAKTAREERAGSFTAAIAASMGIDPMKEADARVRAAADRIEAINKLGRERERRGQGGMGGDFTGPTPEMLSMKIKVESDVPVRTKVELEQASEQIQAIIENLGLQGAGA